MIDGTLNPQEHGLRDDAAEYADKIEQSILPPDPGRILSFLVEDYAAIEHALPVPPLVETTYLGFFDPAIEDLPRLPKTADLDVGGPYLRVNRGKT